jgi:hypothetical protein
MRCHKLEDVFKLYDSKRLLDLDEDELRNAHRICVFDHIDLETYRRASMIAEAILSKIAQNNSVKLTEQISQLNQITLAQAVLAKSSRNESRKLIAETIILRKITRRLFYITIILAILAAVAAIPIVKDWIKPSHNEIRLIIDHPNTNAVMQITFPAFPSDKQLKNQN